MHPLLQSEVGVFASQAQKQSQILFYLKNIRMSLLVEPLLLNSIFSSLDSVSSLQVFTCLAFVGVNIFYKHFNVCLAITMQCSCIRSQENMTTTIKSHFFFMQKRLRNLKFRLITSVSPTLRASAVFQKSWDYFWLTVINRQWQLPSIFKLYLYFEIQRACLYEHVFCAPLPPSNNVNNSWK